ncbi:hypothetical protein Dda_8766 [Drechslerella dactyloides]|uniref:Uncharacterized protein n=1 Tax=Drechslerella dactyloides TaxID=74499 RepID=A0AAD6NFK1_DREDA|nr:hypothetical protein Dda_8766 [Drechslerella dactyloides]
MSMAVLSETSHAQEEARSILREFIHTGGNVNEYGNGDVMVTYGQGSDLLQQLRSLHEELADLKEGHATLATKYAESEQTHMVDKAVIKGKLNSLYTFAKVSKSIRLRHLHTFARDHPDLCTKYGIKPNFVAIQTGNIAAHEGDAMVDMELVTTSTEDLLFELSYGIKASDLRRHTDNEILIALVNCRCTFFSQIPKTFHARYDEMAVMLSNRVSFQAQLFSCCGADFEIKHYNGQVSAWADVVEKHRLRVVEAALFLKNLSE